MFHRRVRQGLYALVGQLGSTSKISRVIYEKALLWSLAWALGLPKNERLAPLPVPLILPTFYARDGPKS